MSETESMQFELGPRPLHPRSKTILISALVIVAAATIGLIVRAALMSGSAADTDPILRVIPANTAMYFSMTTHPEEQPNYNAIADAWKDSSEANQLESAMELGLNFVNLDWEVDVLSWLGERAGFALVDFGGYDGRIYQVPFVILAAHSRDAAASDAFLTLIRDRITANSTTQPAFETSDYRGVTITYVAGNTGDEPDYLASVTVDDVVVVTLGGPDQMKQVIDAALDGTALSNDARFNELMNRLPTPTVGMFYMDLANYSRSFESLMSSTGASIGLLAEQIEMMKTIGSMGGSISYEPQGIRIEAVSDLDLENNPASYLNFNNFDLTPPSNRIYDSIPASASLAANMRANGAYIYDQVTSADYLDLLTASSRFFNGEEILAQIDQFEQQVGIDLKADVFDLLNGELAFALLEKAAAPDDNFSSFAPPSFPFEVALMLDSSDIDRLSKSVDKLMQAAVDAERGIALQPLDSLPATALINEDNDILLSYGTVDGHFAIGSTPDTLRAIDTADQNPLSADATFQTAMSALPDSQQQSGYIALRPFWNWFASLSERFDEPCPVCNYLQGFKWISFSGSYEDIDAGISRATFFIGVEKP